MGGWRHLTKDQLRWEGNIEQTGEPNYPQDLATKKYVDDEIGAIDLSPYWKNDGTSTATGNWDIGANDFTTTGTLEAGAIKGTSFIIGADTLSSLSKVSTFEALADATGVLTNDGAGNLSWGAGGGGSVSFGTDNQIPYTNSAGNDFDYSDNFKFSGSKLDIVGQQTIDSSSVASGNGFEVLGGTKDTPVVPDNEDTIAVYGAGRAYFKGRDVTNDIEFVMGTSTAGVAFAGSMSDNELEFRVKNRLRGYFMKEADDGLFILSANGERPTSTSTKIGRFGIFHYSSSEEPFYVIGAASTSSGNNLAFGGGSSNANSATRINFNTGGTTTTLQGSAKLTIKRNDYVSFQNVPEVRIDEDNLKLTFGTGQDASVYYNGTNLIINPKEVGSGILDVTGTLQTDGYNSADGSAGITTTFVDGDGNTITIKNGLVTAKTAP
jgi:hypothetical protein